jgi:hypothetical protein
MRKAINFFRSYYEIAKELDDKNRLAFYDALLDKQFENKDHELTGMAKFAYLSQKHSIDAQIKGYFDKTKEEKFNPTKGGSVAPWQGGTKGGSVAPSVQVQEKVQEKVQVQVKEDIDSRKLKFAGTLKPFLHIYGKDLLNDFYHYWTEPNKSNTKLNFELQKTWSVERRLNSWSKNEKNFNKKTNGNETRTTSQNNAVEQFKQRLVSSTIQ